LKIVGKWLARVIWPVFVLAWSALLALSALAANLPIGQDIYIRSSDANLYIRASTFFQDNNPTSLGTCRRGDDLENCRWILEPSKQRPGSYYIRLSDTGWYLHTNGGSREGGYTTLHPCPPVNNHGNCQWILEPSKQRPGSYYIRSSDEGLYLHTHGGSAGGYPNRLNACSKLYNYGNCQWLIEARAPSFSAGLVPPLAPPMPTARGSANQ